MFIPMISCNKDQEESEMNIVFLHHSTGEIIWKGYTASLFNRAIDKISSRLADALSKKALLPSLFDEYNEEQGMNYAVSEMTFPKASPYGWNNFPFDYYNIWVRNEGSQNYREEPTLEILTKKYNVIILKHCFPVCYIEPDQDSADINSDAKTLANYKLQYDALRNKLYEFPDTRFILFTGAAQVASNISAEMAERAREFFNWVKEEWDIPDDNIYLWDLYKLQTEGGLYFKDEYAMSSQNSHPNTSFVQKVTPLLFHRIIDVIENGGKGTEITGEESISITE